MLAAGRSRPWPQTLYHLTGEREMTASAILEYFSPLQEWLVKYRSEKGYTTGWKRKKVLSTSPVVSGARKTLPSSTQRSPNDKTQTLSNKTQLVSKGKNSTSSGKNGTADVTFPDVKKNDDAINLGKPDLKAALAAMGPALKASEENSAKGRDNSLLDPKSAILGAKPMFVPNKIKDQLVLG